MFFNHKSESAQYAQGIVMSIEKAHLVVLSSGGEFVKRPLPRERIVIGDTIRWCTVETQTIKINHRRAWQIAMSLCLVLSMSVVSWAYPVGQIYLEINPSLGIEYNVYQRVVGVKSYNEDAKRIAEKLDVYGKGLDEGVSETVKTLDDQGYFNERDKAIYIGFSNRSESVEKMAVQAIDSAVEKTNHLVSLSVVEVKAEQTAKAKEQSVSPMKIALVENPVTPLKLERIEKLKERLKKIKEKEMIAPPAAKETLKEVKKAVVQKLNEAKVDAAKPAKKNQKGANPVFNNGEIKEIVKPQNTAKNEVKNENTEKVSSEVKGEKLKKIRQESDDLVAELADFERLGEKQNEWFQNKIIQIGALEEKVKASSLGEDEKKQRIDRLEALKNKLLKRLEIIKNQGVKKHEPKSEKNKK